MVGNEQEITARSVLLDALEREDGVLRMHTVNGMGLIPISGHQEIFRAQQEKCRILRDLIQSLGSEDVRRSIAQWQKDEMEGRPLDVRELDRVQVVNRVPPVRNTKGF